MVTNKNTKISKQTSMTKHDPRQQKYKSPKPPLFRHQRINPFSHRKKGEGEL